MTTIRSAAWQRQPGRHSLPCVTEAGFSKSATQSPDSPNGARFQFGAWWGLFANDPTGCADSGVKVASHPWTIDEL